MAKFTKVTHPLVDHSLTILRNKETGIAEFRRHTGIVSRVLLLEATKQLAVVSQPIETPLGPIDGKKLEDKVVVVPVLRAGLAMLFAVQDFWETASVGIVGMERDENTAQPHEYYRKLPPISGKDKVIVLDPMLATGGSLEETVTTLKEKGAQNITLVCIVAAPEGIEHIRKSCPDVSIITAAVDDRLDAQKFIVPGLGDFGDRYFGT